MRLPNGKALTGYGHEITRSGTRTLVAAFEAATGLVNKPGISSAVSGGSSCNS